MKLLFMLLLIGSGCQIQSSPFVDYLLLLQNTVENTHLSMNQLFASVRSQMSYTLNTLNSQAVSKVANALEQVINISNLTGGEITRLPEQDACSQNLREEWLNALEVVGDELAACAKADMDDVYIAVNQVHEFIQNHTLVSFEIQNLVLQSFTEINPVTQANDIQYIVEGRFNQINEEFLANYPILFNDLLNRVVILTTSVPANIEICNEIALEKFETSAISVRGRVDACL